MLEFDGTLIVLAISFIIFAFSMNFIFYSPMNAVRKERKKYIKGNLKTVESNNNKAQELVEKQEKRIIKAKRESSEYVNKHTSEMNKKRSLAMQEALQTSKAKVQDLKEKLAQEKADKKGDVKREVSKLAAEISKKILGKEIPIAGLSDEVIEKALEG